MLTVSIISIKVLHIFLFLYNSNFPDSSVGKASACNCRRPRFDFWGGKIPWRRDRLPTPIFLGFSCGSASKESACNVEDLGSIQESTCNVGDLGLITGLERSPGDPWRKEKLPIPVFWPREFHGLYSAWGRKESDTTERLHVHFSLSCMGGGNGNPLQIGRAHVWNSSHSGQSRMPSSA